MLVYGVVCKNCLTAIWSKYRHDYHTCPCGSIFVDGGRDYLRYGTLKDVPEPPQVIIDRITGAIYVPDELEGYKVEEK